MAIKYQILRMETIGTPPLMRHGGVPFQYDDAAQAAKSAKEYAAIMGEKLCVKPVVNSEWREREQRRFVDGTYRPLPWIGRNWWEDSYAIWKDHYPHASLEKPGWIAFTKDEVDGAKDKQTLLRPGAYLNRYFEKTLNNYGYSERRFVDEFMKMYGPIEVKFAATPEEVIKVYDMLHTCMSQRAWPKGIHPATMYLAGDLQVAYLGDIATGRIAARSLVWPERKLHSRVYGDIARLTQGLERLGYKWGAPIGAKIKRVELSPVKFDNGETPVGCFLVPYIDKRNQAGGGHLSVIDKTDHLVICEEGEPGSHHAGQASGHSGLYVPREDEYPTFDCQRCGKKGFRKVHPVMTCTPDDEDDEDGNPVMWCQTCLRYAKQCGYSGNRYNNDVEMVQVDGIWWAEYYADMYAVRCEGNGQMYSDGNTYEVWISATKFKRYSAEFARGEFGGVVRSTLTQRIFPKRDLAYIYDAYGERGYCAKWELTTRAFQCDGCDKHGYIENRNQSCGDDRLFCAECHLPIKAGKTPRVSPTRRAFELARDQLKLGLDAPKAAPRPKPDRFRDLTF